MIIIFADRRMFMRRNFSAKRQAIYDMLINRTDHPSATQIYEDLKEDYPDLSLGTVYRNISLFKDEKMAISVCSLNGEERIDGNTTPHTHLVCTYCGKITDLFTNDIGTRNNVVGDGFIIEKRAITYYGRCRECDNRLKSKNIEN